MAVLLHLQCIINYASPEPQPFDWPFINRESGDVSSIAGGATKVFNWFICGTKWPDFFLLCRRGRGRHFHRVKLYARTVGVTSWRRVTRPEDDRVARVSGTISAPFD